MRWMSFWTSFSSNLRPIRRLTAYSVFFALVTACRFADAPTRISPSSWYATIEGVVRAPSLFSMTFGVLPSMMATQEFVVPRSMPMIRPMMFSPCSGPSGAVVAYVRYLWIRCVDFKLDRAISFELFRGRHSDERRPEEAVGDQVALLQDADDRLGFLS